MRSSTRRRRGCPPRPRRTYLAQRELRTVTWAIEGCPVGTQRDLQMTEMGLASLRRQALSARLASASALREVGRSG